MSPDTNGNKSKLRSLLWTYILTGDTSPCSHKDFATQRVTGSHVPHRLNMHALMHTCTNAHRAS